MLNITNNQGSANQNYDEISPQSYQDGYYKKEERPRIAKVILRKKNGAGESGSLTSDYITKLQSSKQNGTRTKTELEINEIQQRAQN